MNGSSRIADLADVPADPALLCTVRDGFGDREVVLTRTDDGEVAAYENYRWHLKRESASRCGRPSRWDRYRKGNLRPSP